MLYAKLSWLPPYSTALTFDESHYLSMADQAALNPGTGDFGIFGIFKVAADITTTEANKLLIGKGPYDLTSDVGWWIGIDAANKKIIISVNDGDATPLLEYSSSDSFVLGEWYWLAVLFDRSGNASIYLGRFSTGTLSLVHSVDISSYTGTWTNTDSLWVGNWGATANRYLKGALSHLRIDMDRLVPATWLTQEWDRIRYAYPTGAGDFTGFWPFQNDLLDTSANYYTFTYNGGGSEAFEDGAPYDLGNIELLLRKSTLKFTDGETELDAMDSARALDGTLNTCLTYTKRMVPIDFEGINLAELTALRAAYAAGNVIGFYNDSLLPRTFQGIMLEPPDSKEIVSERYEGGFELEET